MLSPGASPTRTVISGPVLSLHTENTLEKPRRALEQAPSGEARNPILRGLRLIASASPPVTRRKQRAVRSESQWWGWGQRSLLSGEGRRCSIRQWAGFVWLHSYLAGHWISHSHGDFLPVTPTTHIESSGLKTNVASIDQPLSKHTGISHCHLLQKPSRSNDHLICFDSGLFLFFPRRQSFYVAAGGFPSSLSRTGDGAGRAEKVLCKTRILLIQFKKLWSRRLSRWPLAKLWPHLFQKNEILK